MGNIFSGNSNNNDNDNDNDNDKIPDILFISTHGYFKGTKNGNFDIFKTYLNIRKINAVSPYKCNFVNANDTNKFVQSIRSQIKENEIDTDIDNASGSIAGMLEGLDSTAKGAKIGIEDSDDWKQYVQEPERYEIKGDNAHWFVNKTYSISGIEKTENDAAFDDSILLLTDNGHKWKTDILSEMTPRSHYKNSSLMRPSTARSCLRT